MWISVRDLYYLTAVGLGEMARFPGLRKIVVGTAGLCAYHLSRKKRRQIEASMSRSHLAALAPAERRLIVRRVFHETWREILMWSQLHGSLPEIDVHGLEHLRAGLARGRGVILWESNGFGRRLLSKHVLWTRGIEVHQIHGPNRFGGFLVHDVRKSTVRRLISRFFDAHEMLVVSDIVRLPQGTALAHTRRVIDLLGRNAVVCMPGDGRVGHRLISRQLLGRPVPFATGAASLARLTGAALVPMFCFDESSGRPVLVLEPPGDVPATLSREAAAAEIVQHFVDRLAYYVERFPGQYRNWHLIDEGPDGERPMEANP